MLRHLLAISSLSICGGLAQSLGQRGHFRTGPIANKLYWFESRHGTAVWHKWTAVPSYCSGIGPNGKMLLPISLTENNFVGAVLDDVWPHSDEAIYKWTGPPIAVRDTAVEGTWKNYYTGAVYYTKGVGPATGKYNNWRAGQPDDAGSGEDCAYLSNHRDEGTNGKGVWTWNDWGCARENAFYVCEFVLSQICMHSDSTAWKSWYSGPNGQKAVGEGQYVTATCTSGYYAVLGGVLQSSNVVKVQCLNKALTKTVTCERVCPLPSLPNGKVTEPAATKDSKARKDEPITFSCNSGFGLFVASNRQTSNSFVNRCITPTSTWSTSPSKISCKRYCTTPSVGDSTITGNSLNPTHHGDSVVVTCNNKHILKLGGAKIYNTLSTTRSCSNGVWSDTRTIACPLKTCTKPDESKAAVALNIAGQDTVEIDKTVTYTCDTNYRLSVDGAFMNSYDLVCLDEETWAKPAVLCLAPCSKPSAGSGTNVAGGNPVLHGNDATYTCATDYLMEVNGALQTEGTSYKKTCDNGAFSDNSKVVCKAYCTTPSVADSTITGNSLNPTHHGDSVVVTCNDKHILQLDGVKVNDTLSATRSCSNGVWSDSTTIACPIKTCTKPDESKAAISLNIAGPDTVEIDKTVTYTCDTDYRLSIDGAFVNSYDLVCVDEETWAKPAVLCLAPCSIPSAGSGTNVAGGNPILHGNDATYTCATDYLMEVNGALQTEGTSYKKTCDNGAFSDNSIVVCKGSCTMQTLANGVVVGDSKHGGSVTFTCDAEYTMTVRGIEETGNFWKKTCDDENWDDLSEVRCVKEPCTRPTLANGVVVDNSQWFWAGPVIDGNTAAYYCKDGYTLSVNGVNQLRNDPAVPEKYFRKCLGAEAWDASDSVMCLVGCDFPVWDKGSLSGQSYIVNGTEREMVATGDAVTYTCPSHYVQTVDGVAQATNFVQTCEGSNMWTESGSIDCIAPCTNMPQFVGPIITGLQPTPFEESITITCPDVLYLNGVEQAGSLVTWTCNGADTWSSNDEVACGSQCQTTVVSNAKSPFDSVQTVNENEMVSFGCNVGYRPQYLEMQCTADGLFDQSIPTCRKVCEIPHIDNGTLQSVTNEKADFVEIGGLANRVCFGWFKTTDTSQATCQPDGTFDSLHACKSYCIVSEVKNGGFEDSSSGDTKPDVGSLVIEGDNLTPSCDEGFLVSDSTPSVCLGSGQLDKLHTCIPKGCLIPPIANGNFDITEGELVSIGVKITATCTSGFRLGEVVSATCLDDGQFHSSPYCIDTKKKYYPIIGIGIGSAIGVAVAVAVLCYDRTHMWRMKK